jgi:hypothetical protein
MPASRSTEPDNTPATSDDATTAKTKAPSAQAEPEPAEVPEGRLPAGVYGYVGTIPTLYLDVPLTARPAGPGRPAEGDDPGEPATPATVFAWPFTAPDDGRWQPSKKKPNQLPDNAPADSEE